MTRPGVPHSLPILHCPSSHTCPRPSLPSAHTKHQSQETASSIQGLHQWVTNEYLHCGIREAGAVIFERLLNLTRGGILPR